ncbi:biosynthetic-type acetolactate synthase large subunit [uncultured Victivallis sp.]|uniref:biosynthetic-type acetolactate synthase large subunit n=1 Tax=uncultured Victivallis sp. TaxID=354118 RepID=UPI0025F1E3A2|nr:biosynthetic-type acetolactate synthase large subunit [uncultured Victivallis sp.]
MDTPKTPSLLKGSEITIKCLELLGVDVVFAYPGGQAIELHQALSKSKMRVVLPRHEQGGAFAAGGYARISGKVGVCMATSGPGATNLVSGIADAYMDSIPTVFITGQVSSAMIGKNVFQETDIIGVTRPIVKHSFLVLDAKDIPQIMKEAFYIASSGRPGPVVVDIPKNVQQQRVEFNFDVPVALNYYHPDPVFDPADAEKIRELIAGSKRPCVYAGGGIISAGASAELLTFAESYNIPVVTTLMGIGAFPEKHPLSLRWLGMHGSVFGNYAANECDLLLAFGARFDDRVTGNPQKFATRAKIVHVDIDDSEINKNKPADLGIVANIKDVLAALNEHPLRQEYADWFARIAEWKAKYPYNSYRVKPDHVQPQFVMQELSRLTDGKAVIVPGVGQHQMWAAQYYDYSFPRQLLTSGGLGAMGFGLPAAMGAKIACPEKTVINIDGDGSFQMNIQELGTLFVEEIDVKMIILNNQHLGMVAQWEDRFYDHNRGNTVLGRCKGSNGCGAGKDCDHCDGTRCTGGPYPDFVMIASGYGIPGRRVFKREELAPAIEEMLAYDGPFLLDVYTGYDEHVLPMIPPGGDYTTIIME